VSGAASGSSAVWRIGLSRRKPAGFTRQSRRIFWHTSCTIFRVARKFQVVGNAKAASEAAIMNLRKAATSLAGTQGRPRVRKIPTLRRRVPVTVIAESGQPVIIRHIGQNLGSVISEIRPTQSQRV
jgi:hypothetical protein